MCIATKQEFPFYPNPVGTTIFCFETDHGDKQPERHFVVAETVDITLYYGGKDLKDVVKKGDMVFDSIGES